MPVQKTIDLLKQGYAFVRENDLKTVASAIHSKEAHPVIQFAKYGICGGAATVASQAIFFSLSYTVIPAMDGMIVDGELITDALRARNSLINNSIGWVFGNVVAYYTNVIWVFQGGRHNRWLEFGYFTLVSAISFIAGILAGPLIIKLYGVPTMLAQLTLLVTAVLVNYVCRKFFIFRK